MMKLREDYDALVIGGGPAGLSAAMALGRLSRKTIVCDGEEPRNATSDQMNNFPSQDGIHPSEWRKRARKDLEKYTTVHFFSGLVATVKQEEFHFRAILSSGAELRVRKVILAYGILDQFPSISGLRELWGKSVLHCPFCHGFEVRSTRLGIIANGKAAEHLLPMIYSLSNDCIVFTHGPPDLTNEFRAQLVRRNVPLIEGEIKSLVNEGGRLKAVILANGDAYERENLFLALRHPIHTKSDIGERLGCEKNEIGFYKLREFGKTTIDGVFAAGDIVTGQHSVLSAAATGQMAGAGAASELLKEDFAAT